MKWPISFRTWVSFDNSREKKLNTMAPSSNCEYNGGQRELLILSYINYHEGENIVKKKNYPKALGHSSKVAEMYSVSIVVFTIHRSKGAE